MILIPQRLNQNYSVRTIFDDITQEALDKVSKAYLIKYFQFFDQEVESSKFFTLFQDQSG
jgi:hypothetical protein